MQEVGGGWKSVLECFDTDSDTDGEPRFSLFRRSGSGSGFGVGTENRRVLL